jgi:peroxiredoxin
VDIPRYAARALSLVLAFAAAGCGGAQGNATGSAASSAGVAPDFELDSLSGDPVRLGDHLGKDVVLVDFWATYCEPCLVSMPHLDALYEKYKARGFVVLGVSLDGPNSIAQVRAEVQKLGIKFPILLDQETRVVGLYNPRTSAPYSVLIGRDGRIRAKREGYTTGGTQALEADIVAALEAR